VKGRRLPQYIFHLCYSDCTRWWPIRTAETRYRRKMEAYFIKLCLFW